MGSHYAEFDFFKSLISSPLDQLSSYTDDLEEKFRIEDTRKGVNDCKLTHANERMFMSLWISSIDIIICFAQNPFPPFSVTLSCVDGVELSELLLHRKWHRFL